jgi:hypothetical protein
MERGFLRAGSLKLPLSDSLLDKASEDAVLLYNAGGED